MRKVVHVGSQQKEKRKRSGDVFFIFVLAFVFLRKNEFIDSIVVWIDRS